MSYLDRLKQKISQDMPRGGATKATEGAFVPFVATRSAPLRQNLSREAVSQGWQPTEADLQEGIREHLEERAAILEYDGDLSHAQAETQAKVEQRLYEYRLTDNGPDGPWLILLAPGCDLPEAERSLKNRFGAYRVLAVRERGFPVNLLVEE